MLAEAATCGPTLMPSTGKCYGERPASTFSQIDSGKERNINTTVVDYPVPRRGSRRAQGTPFPALNAVRSSIRNKPNGKATQIPCCTPLAQSMLPLSPESIWENTEGEALSVTLGNKRRERRNASGRFCERCGPLDGSEGIEKARYGDPVLSDPP